MNLCAERPRRIHGSFDGWLTREVVFAVKFSVLLLLLLAVILLKSELNYTEVVVVVVGIYEQHKQFNEAVSFCI